MIIKKNKIFNIKNNFIINDNLSNFNKFDLIVSLTTYKERLETDNLILVLNKILQQKFNRKIHIVVNLTRYDYQYCSKNLLNYFKLNNIEILICKENLKSHLKYFYVMKKYKNLPIITIDDDCLYDEDLLQTLWDSYSNDKTCIHARRCHLMLSDKNNFFISYNKWLKKYTKIKVPTYQLLATGVGGVLYPPNILKISDDLLPEIYKSITADDIFLKKRENELGIKIQYVGNKPESYENLPEYKNSSALQLINNKGGNDKIVKALDFKPNINLNRYQKIYIILRCCDSIDCINNNLCKDKKREFGNNKKDVIKTCVYTLLESIKNANDNGIDCFLYIINDNLSLDTINFLNLKANSLNIRINWMLSNGTGNINSFKTCFEYAINNINNSELVLFIEDDYLIDINAISEIINFYSMFQSDIWLNPTTDIGDEKIVPIDKQTNTFKKTIVLPSSKEGIGIWWKQTYHSTSTFCTTVSMLKKYQHIFNYMFTLSKLNQYERNKIYQSEKCFTPIYPLMQHYQKSKTMYWFDKRNTVREVKYNI